MKQRLAEWQHVIDGYQTAFAESLDRWERMEQFYAKEAKQAVEMMQFDNKQPQEMHDLLKELVGICRTLGHQPTQPQPVCVCVCVCSGSVICMCGVLILPPDDWVLLVR